MVAHDDQNLPPRDRGRVAWMTLFAVCLALTLTWGFGSCFGVFREYYFYNGLLAGNQLVASTGVIQIGVLHILPTPLLRYLTLKPQHQKPMMWVGMVIIVAAALGAAFSTKPYQVIITQGALYGIGSGLLVAPSMAFIDEWFLERRGLANGIFFGSNNLASAACSPIFAIVLRKFGPRVVLIAWAVIAGAGISLSIFLVRSRNASRQAAAKPEFSWRPFAKPLFWLFSFSMLIQGLANMLPANYLPSYCTDMGLPIAQGALLITFLSLSGVVGQSLLGLLTDKIGALVPLLLSTLVSAFAVLVLWGLGRSYWMLVLLSILFGAFSFSFVVFRSHMAAAVIGDKLHPNEELVVSGALLATRGIACIASGYTGAALVGASEFLGIRAGYGAGKWRALIIYEGVLMFGASMGALGFLGKRKTAAEGSEKTQDQGWEALAVSTPTTEIVTEPRKE